jgi:hypothetical protein
MSWVVWAYGIGVIAAMACVGRFMAVTKLRPGDQWRPAGTAFFVLAWPLVVAGFAVLFVWIMADEWRQGRSE